VTKRRHQVYTLESRSPKWRTTLRWRGLATVPGFRYFLVPGQYDQVLVLDTLPAEAGFTPQRSASGRTSCHRTSIAIGNIIEEVYREWGYETLRVAVMPIEDRAAWVLDQIGLKTQTSCREDPIVVVEQQCQLGQVPDENPLRPFSKGTVS